MSKKWIIVLLGIAAAVSSSLLFYAHRRQPGPRNPAAVSRHVQTSPTAIKRNPNAALSTAGRPTAKGGYSQKEYDLLWQKYKPLSGRADGPRPKWALDLTASQIEHLAGDKKLIPVFDDVIYGRSVALENKLDTGLSADATIPLGYPVDHPVSLLEMAVETGQRDVIAVLLRHNASTGPVMQMGPDITTFQSDSPLPLAALYGEDDVVRILLQRGANINQERALKTDHSTPLQLAVTAGNVSTVYLLLTHGADVNSALGPNGSATRWMLLHVNDDRVVALRQLLVKYGAKMPETH